MDELEISGKRYISTRRAAKENKYHSDYIGQLIRGGKVQGQKVGRSWYVVADSLTDYLNHEVPPKVIEAPIEPVYETSVVEVVQPVASEKTEENHKPPVADETVESNLVSSEKFIIESEVENAEYQVPLKIKKEGEVKIEILPKRSLRKGLRYMADDGPLYPDIERNMPQAKNVAIDNNAVIQVANISKTSESKGRVKKRSVIAIAIRTGAIIFFGSIALAVMVVGSSAIVSTTTVVGGTSSVSYSIESLK